MRTPFSRRSLLKGMGGLAAGLGLAQAAPGRAAAVAPGVLAVPVLNPRASISQPPGQQAVQLHSHTNVPLDHQPWLTSFEVLSWYATHGYNAAAVTNLMHHSPTHGVAAVLDDPGRFLVIQGVEPSAEPDGTGIRIVDTLGVFLTRDGFAWDPAAQAGKSTQEILTAEAQAIRAVGGLPIVAHPVMTEPVAPEAIARSDPGSHPRLLEVCNPEPGTRWKGGGGIPGATAVWDKVLDLGRTCWGVAADDAHHFAEFSKSREPNRHLANPGQAWVQVWSEELTVPALRKAMEAGRFYATFGPLGIILLDYQADRDGVRLTLNPATSDLGWSVGDHDRRLYMTRFFGDGGVELKVDESYTPSCGFLKGTRRIRAEVEDDGGNLLWTQPHFK